MDPIYIDLRKVLVHPFRPQEFHRYKDLVQDVYRLMSDHTTLKFLPGEELNSLPEVNGG